jgi:hypothetical protein
MLEHTLALKRVKLLLEVVPWLQVNQETILLVLTPALKSWLSPAHALWVDH